MSKSEGSWLLTSESAEKISSYGIGSESSCFSSHGVDFSIFGCDDIFDFIWFNYLSALMRYGTKSIRDKFIYTLTTIKLCVLQCFWMWDLIM